MGLFDWLFEKKKKRLTEMSGGELRIEERLLARQRDQLSARMARLGDDKRKLFDKGAKEKSPELRRTMAQQFELATSEQVMLGRELNTKSKELMTVSRVRMIAERKERSRAGGDMLGRIGEADMLKIEAMIEDDAIKAEMYNERLDEMLGVMHEVDQGEAGLSVGTQSILDAWNRVDEGVEQVDEAFADADQSVRAVQSRQAEGA